jgi:hypothetical protein
MYSTTWAGKEAIAPGTRAIELEPDEYYSAANGR